MKAKLLTISILTVVSIFVFSGATWADGKKNRKHSGNEKQHYKAAKHRNPVGYDRCIKKPYSPNWHRQNYRHKPFYRHHYSPRSFYRPHKYMRRPIIKHRYPLHRRPIYSRSDGKVSIVASTVDKGWKIRISSRN